MHQPRTESPPTESLSLNQRRREGPWTVEVGTAHGVESRTLLVGESLVLGNSHSVALRVADCTVSRRHCVVRAENGVIAVEDLDSTNGVFVGPARVRAAQLSGDGASFVIGRTTVTITPRLASESLQRAELPGIIGDSPAMRRVAVEVRRHATTRAPVLLQGESGTGKDLVARALHALSKRPGEYVPVNAGGILEGLADTELFGHRRGSFTGAVSNRSGAFELAHRGTLFLDEVAEVAHSIQVKLLRVVEDGQVRPVGAAKALTVDTRIVSASWAPLAERVVEGRFRADLYHRLSMAVIRLPPLRERMSDVPALCVALLGEMAPDVGPKRLSTTGLARLVAYRWPGNVRELRGVLYRAALKADKARIEADHIDFAIPPDGRTRQMTPADAQQLVAQFHGNVSAAARAAGMARTTFRAMLEKGRRPGSSR